MLFGVNYFVQMSKDKKIVGYVDEMLTDFETYTKKVHEMTQTYPNYQYKEASPPQSPAPQPSKAPAPTTVTLSDDEDDFGPRVQSQKKFKGLSGEWKNLGIKSGAGKSGCCHECGKKKEWKKCGTCGKRGGRGGGAWRGRGKPHKDDHWITVYTPKPGEGWVELQAKRHDWWQGKDTE